MTTMTETTTLKPGTTVRDPDPDSTEAGAVVDPATLTPEELIEAIETNAGIAVIRWDTGQLTVRIAEYLLPAD
jgi:hypothetical protein